MNALWTIKCLTPNIVYEAKVSNKTNNECNRYLSASNTLFKEKFRKLNRDWKWKCTELYKYILISKFHGMAPIVKSTNYCNLYLTEKFTSFDPSAIQIY